MYVHIYVYIYIQIYVSELFTVDEHKQTRITAAHGNITSRVQFIQNMSWWWQVLKWCDNPHHNHTRNKQAQRH